MAPTSTESAGAKCGANMGDAGSDDHPSESRPAANNMQRSIRRRIFMTEGQTVYDFYTATRYPNSGANQWPTLPADSSQPIRLQLVAARSTPLCLRERSAATGPALIQLRSKRPNIIQLPKLASQLTEP
jgi:hypothetical protein